MKLDPPMLTVGPLSGKVYVVTHGNVEPHPTEPGKTMVVASVKYDVTDQFESLAARSEPERLREAAQAFVDAALNPFDSGEREFAVLRAALNNTEEAR